MTTFFPPITGRSTTQLSIARLLFQINSDQSAIQSLQTQLSTGRRITRPSEDPASALRALTLQRQIEFKDQVSINLRSADTHLSLTEATLSQAQDILNEIRGVAVQATGTTNSPEEREAYIAQVQAAINTLTDLGNAKFRDQFIFGGSDVSRAPFSHSGNAVRFSGNDQELRTISDFGTTLTANVTAEDAFGVRSDQKVSTIDLNPSIAGDTPLWQLHGGDGIQPGAIRLSGGSEVLQVDLSNAYDLNDVVTQISALEIDGRGLSATLSSSGINISYADGLGGVLRINEVGTGKTATSLGIYNYNLAALSPVVGGDLDPIVTAETPLSQLFQGTGINVGESIQIRQGDQTYEISTLDAETVEDLIDRINASDASVLAAIDDSGRSLSIQSTESGTLMSIGEQGGTLATVLGIRTMNRDTPLSELNGGRGVGINENLDDLILLRTNGTELRIDLDSAVDIDDVLNSINNNVDNFAPGLRISASLATNGNGIVLSAATGAQPIGIRVPGGTQAAWDLGLVPEGETQVTGSVAGGSSVINGTDVSGIEVEGIFTTLIQLKQAIESERIEDMPRVAAKLDDDLQRLAMSRGLVGTRQQNIARTQDLSAEQQLLLTQMESDELDADLAQTISELTAREAALQASLNLMGQTARLTLFDYL